MKIQMTKKGMTRYCQDYEKELLEAAGWSVAEPVKAEEEIIRPKPTVKTKATVRAVEEANDIKGDE